MTLQEEAEQCAKREYCDGCKGQPLLKYDSNCTETCDGFKAEIEQILKEWATEDAAREPLVINMQSRPNPKDARSCKP